MHMIFTMPTRLSICLPAVLLFLLAGHAFALPQNGYRLDASPGTPFYATTNPLPPGEAAAMATPLICSGGSAELSVSVEPHSGLMLQSAVFGQTVEHIKPEYYIGDVIEVPKPADAGLSGDDWAVTVKSMEGGYELSGGFYEPSTGQVRPDRGGELIVTWQFKNSNGDAREETYRYTIGSAPSGVPYRLYWTEGGYNGPKIDLSGKFVKLHLNDSIFQVCTPSTNENAQAGEMDCTPSVYLDDQNLLRALPGPEGYFLLQYFKTNDRTNQISPEGCIVVEVCSPQTYTVDAEIGSRLYPSGSGYSITSFFPDITSGETEGYCYRHPSGTQADWVYPVRRTDSMPWLIEIYWKIEDLMGVAWPFELDWYAARWPADCQTYVRGDSNDWGAPVLIPPAYTATVMPYQEPFAHAALDESLGLFYSFATNAYSLLKLESQGAVSFVPVHSVSRKDARFSQTPKPWAIGSEIQPYASSVGLLLDGKYDSAFAVSNLMHTGSWSVEAWMRLPVTSGGGLTRTLASIDHGAASPLLLQLTDAGELLLRTGEGSQNWQSLPPEAYQRLEAHTFLPATWYHVALTATRESGVPSLTVMLLVDGKPVTTFTCASPENAALSTIIFGRNTVNLRSTTLALDEIRLWKTALGASEIAARKEGFLIMDDAATVKKLLRYYPIESGRGEKIADAVQVKAAANEASVDFDSLMANSAQAIGSSRMEPGAIGLKNRTTASTSHGYIYQPGGTFYNPTFYQSPEQMASRQNNASEEIENAAGSSEWAIAADVSYIFGVNAQPGTNAVQQAANRLEVWWGDACQDAFMGTPIWFPSHVQHYLNTEPDDLPQIVIASGEGSRTGGKRAAGGALSFNRERTAGVILPALQLGATSFTVEAWVRPRSLHEGDTLFELGSGIPAASTPSAYLRLANAEGALQYICFEPGTPIPHTLTTTNTLPLNAWSHLAVTQTGTALTLYLNGDPIARSATMPTIAGYALTTNLLARSSEIAGSALDADLDEVRIWSQARTPEAIAEGISRPPATGSPGLIARYAFNDTAPVITDETGNFDATLVGGGYIRPGVPQDFGTMIPANTRASLYIQNDRTQPGFNPNEEHAVLLSEADGMVAYALRNDLNAAGESPPIVFVQGIHEETQKPFMLAYSVCLTNETYSTFSYAMTAGQRIPGPAPLLSLPEPYSRGKYDAASGLVTQRGNVCTAGSGWVDRKNCWWAMAAGPDGADAALTMLNYYPMQESFWFPDSLLRGDGASPGTLQPEIGTLLPFAQTAPVAFTSQGYPLTGTPSPVTWAVSWPEDVPVLRIGETLTTARNDLPEVWNQKSVEVLHGHQAVRVIDPVQAKIIPLEATIGSLSLPQVDPLSAFGFTASGQGPTLQRRHGKTYFLNLPPDLSNRFYYDPNRGGSRGALVLVGGLQGGTTSESWLLLNALNADQIAQITALVPEDEGAPEAAAAWRLLIGQHTPELRKVIAADGNTAAEHFALAATGGGIGHFTLAMNNATNPETGVNPSDSIDLYIAAVTNEYTTGFVLALEDETNLLSQRLNLLFNETFAGATSEYTFEWQYAPLNEDGTIPTLDADFRPYPSAAPRLTIGETGDTLSEMGNRVFRCRYRAIDENSPVYGVMGNAWSAWTSPMLAEGWVQRVLNNLTPFEQRMRDLYSNAVEPRISMISQAGKPYRGDVALNMDNVDDVGLIELYQTVLNQAANLSINLGLSDSAANQQLLLAATRLAELYTLLGNEAYADALDPTIGFGTSTVFKGLTSFPEIDFAHLSTSLFAFDNQTPTLLDEELALLRGRLPESTANGTVAPGVKNYPYYNRLVWNFTKGITAGEVAYAVNYGISAEAATAGEVTPESAILSEEDAALLYPQGHGDAWGHYLSALKSYYTLLHHPAFEWGDPAISAMLMGQIMMSTDYTDEEKFAQAALGLAKTGVEIMDRTYRKTYNPARQAMSDAQGQGIRDWGSRTGLSILCNYLSVNAMLPEATESAETNTLRTVNRGTVPALTELAGQMETVQRKMDNADAGLTPQGVSPDAVPFDISPAELDAGKSHYEQIAERATTTLQNAATVLNRAQTATQLLRKQQATAASFAQSLADEEAAINRRLIEIFGYPYPQDIGTGGTYVEGYDGPDIFNYMYVDAASFIGKLEDRTSPLIRIKFKYSNLQENDFPSEYEEDDANSTVLEFIYSSNGPVKPAHWTQPRRAIGKLQEAYQDFLTAVWAYDRDAGAHAYTLGVVKSDLDWLLESLIVRELKYTANTSLAITKLVLQNRLLKAEAEYNKYSANLKEALAKIQIANNQAPLVMIAGLATGGDTAFAARMLAQDATYERIMHSRDTHGRLVAAVDFFGGNPINTLITAFDTPVPPGKASIDAIKMHQQNIATAEASLNLIFGFVENLESVHSTYTIMRDKIGSLAGTQNNAKASYLNLTAAQDAYLTILAEGERLLDERERIRAQATTQIAQLRYQDMLLRLYRNEALERYRQAFDLAQTYTYHAAQAYDYETALLVRNDVSDPGSAFLAEAAKARTIGVLDGTGAPMPASGRGDPGLADILARMNANWSVLKGRLGFNNPSVETGRFSLRHELLRISKEPDGDAAWQAFLEAHWVDDIQALTDYRLSCLPFSGATLSAEPGLVIEFPTSINFGENFFGKELTGGDNAYDSTHFATKIRSVGLWFEGYPSANLANEPRLYLIPQGQDIMRSPTGQLRTWQVKDQVVPVPYAIGDAALDNPDWLPYADAFVNGDSFCTVRRYPMMRAYHDSGSFNAAEMISNSRLVGRSVWNTRWVLIVPAGMLHSDRAKAKELFIRGDGSTPGISDIKLFFSTYSYAGN